MFDHLPHFDVNILDSLSSEVLALVLIHHDAQAEDQLMLLHGLLIVPFRPPLAGCARSVPPLDGAMPPPLACHPSVPPSLAASA